MRRNGALAPAQYVVPAGRVFVVTDLRIHGGIGFSAETNLELQAGAAKRRKLAGFAALEERDTGGLAFDAGTTVDFLNIATFDGGQLDIQVVGYETEDTATLEESGRHAPRAAESLRRGGRAPGTTRSGKPAAGDVPRTRHRPPARRSAPVVGSASAPARRPGREETA